MNKIDKVEALTIFRRDQKASTPINVKRIRGQLVLLKNKAEKGVKLGLEGRAS